MCPAVRVDVFGAHVDSEGCQALRSDGPQAEVAAYCGPSENSVEIVGQIDLTHKGCVPFIHYDLCKGAPAAVLDGQIQEKHVARPPIDDQSQSAI